MPSPPKENSRVWLGLLILFFIKHRRASSKRKCWRGVVGSFLSHAVLLQEQLLGSAALPIPGQKEAPTLALSLSSSCWPTSSTLATPFLHKYTSQSKGWSQTYRGICLFLLERRMYPIIYWQSWKKWICIMKLLKSARKEESFMTYLRSFFFLLSLQSLGGSYDTPET